GRAVRTVLLCLALLPGSAAARGPAPQLPGDLPEEEVPLADADTAAAPVEIRNLPGPDDPAPADWRTGIWEWDREGLQSTRALTLLELLEEIPGIVALRGGDFGQPQTATAFAAGGGRIRVYLDGVELPPL